MVRDGIYYGVGLGVTALLLGWLAGKVDGSQARSLVPAVDAFLSAQAKSVNTYASNALWQVVDGPYKLTSFNNTTGAFTMDPNPSYGGPHAKVMSKLEAVPYTSDTAELNAIKSGNLDFGSVPLTDVPQVGAVKSAGYNVFGYPDFGWEYLVYNFKDTTGDFNNIIKQLYIRQALAHLENEAGYINAFFHGAGGQALARVRLSLDFVTDWFRRQASGQNLQQKASVNDSSRSSFTQPAASMLPASKRLTS